MGTTKTRRNKKPAIPSQLAGTWFGDASDVEYAAAIDGQGCAVAAVDSSDGEEADILDIQFSNDILTFAAYWNSTGRFCRCHLKAHSDGLIELICTYTNQEILRRKTENQRATRKKIKHSPVP